MNLEKILSVGLAFSLLTGCTAHRARQMHKQGILVSRKYQDQTLQNKSEQFYKNLIKKDPNNWEAHLWLAEGYMQTLMDPKKAIPHYEESLKLKPTQLACFHLGEAYAAIGSTKKSIELNLKCIKKWPEDPIAIRHLAQAYENDKQWRKAIGVWKQLSKLKKRERYDKVRPNVNTKFEIITPLTGIDNCYTQLKEHNKALEYENKIIKLIPNSSMGYLLRARTYENMGMHKKAMQDNKKHLLLKSRNKKKNYPTALLTSEISAEFTPSI